MNIKKIITSVILLISIVIASVFGYRYFQQIAIPNQRKPKLMKAKPVVEITTQNELQAILQDSVQPSIIFFHMNDCGWCEKMNSVYQQVVKSTEFSSIQFYTANGNKLQASSLIEELYDEEITGYPFLFFINKKGFLDKQVGFINEKDFESKIKRIFSDILFNNSKMKNQIESDDDVVIQCKYGNCGCCYVTICCSCSFCCGCNCGCYASMWCNECNCKCGSTCGVCNICPCTSNGCICSSNSNCDSGSCYLGLCQSKVGNCGPCGNNGNCSSGNCTNGICYITSCSQGMETCGSCKCSNDGCLCSSDSDCNSGNCFAGICSCSSNGCPCSSDSDCNSGNCFAGFCSCSSDGCPCESNSNCDSGNCYSGFCANCIIPTKNIEQAAIVNNIALDKSGGSKGHPIPICYNNGQCCNCIDGKCSNDVSCKSGTCIVDGDMIAPDINQSLGSGSTCAINSDCSSNLCINGSCSCGDTGPGCSCLQNSTCQSGLVCTNNICVEPCTASGGACTQTTDCCSGYTCTNNICTNNGITCTENHECTSGICNIGTTSGVQGVCSTCGANGWKGCTEDIQCCTGNSCNVAEGYPDGYCNCNSTGCNCMYNYNCQSGVCVEDAKGNPLCSENCLVAGAKCQNSGQCCSGTICMESNNKQGESYCATCGNKGYSCSSNDDCCNNICAGGICSCDTNGCTCSDGSTCQTKVCSNGVCKCLNYNATCSADENCCSKHCSNGKCSNK